VKEVQWFLDTLDIGLPEIKEKTKTLDQAVYRIIYDGTLKDMPILEIESKLWQDGDKNLFRDGLSVQETLSPLSSPRHPAPMLSRSPMQRNLLSPQCSRTLRQSPRSPYSPRPSQLPSDNSDMDLVRSQSIFRPQSIRSQSVPPTTGRGRSLGMGRPRRLF
jgi:hypothetical protein